MDPKKLAYQETTGTVNTYLVNMYVDITIDLLFMQSSKGSVKISHQKAKEDGPTDKRYTSMGMQAHSSLPGRLRQ